MKNSLSARQLAFLSLISSDKVENFFEKTKDNLSTKDLRLAKEIAFGTTRRLLSLEFLSLSLARAKNLKYLKLKKKERFLLYSAIYQFIFMDRVPIFAIVKETVSLAKKYFGNQKAAFFNSLLRSLSTADLSLPLSKDYKSLSVFYSFPEFLVKEIVEEYGLCQAEEYLQSQNSIFPPYVRIRSGFFLEKRKDQENVAFLKDLANCKTIHNKRFQVGKIISHDITPFCNSKNFYIQNLTPILLLESLLPALTKEPRDILDLCAAPGGKALALFDIFPKANFFLNDHSEERIAVLLSNLKKYEMKAEIYCQKAEQMPSDKKFDLIVLDVPCSNSGVLAKRHEARWRIEEKKLTELSFLQIEMIKNAERLLQPSGYLFYMTCSVFRRENEQVVEAALVGTKLKLAKTIKIFPDLNGRDGGFAALFKKS